MATMVRAMREKLMLLSSELGEILAKEPLDGTDQIIWVQSELHNFTFMFADRSLFCK